MLHKKISYLLAAASLFQGAASAHTLFITATSTCSNGAAVIDYTASTDGYAGTANILFNGVIVGGGSLNIADSFQFTGENAAPAGSSVSVSAVATSWDDAFPIGQTAGVSVTIATGCGTTTTDGRFTGGGKQDVDVIVAGNVALNGGDTVDAKGNHVTKGFEIHCDLDHPNSLEVNWSGGHHFHTEVFTSASCSDDPLIKQAPPKAPVDTIVGSGTGRFDGVQGYTIEFSLQDAGEPGTSDKSGFKIYETANPTNVVLLVPMSYVTTGNIQTHFDNK